MAEQEMRAHVAAVMAWYRAMGVDALLEEEPITWLDRVDAPGRALDLSPQRGDGGVLASPVSGSSRPQGVGVARAAVSGGGAAGATLGPAAATSTIARAATGGAGRSFPSEAPDAAELSARQAAGEARTLEELRQILDGFTGCALRSTARSTCFFRGAAKADLLIVGEAPGSEEDREGKPFVGRAGQLLDRMLTGVNLSEDQVHITNIVYWRPPGNRTPTPQEAQICRPFLIRQIELVQPRFVLALGGPAAKHILGVADGIMRVRGKWQDVELGRQRVAGIATLHPAYLLRTPQAKRLAWRDMLAVKAALLKHS